MILFGLILSQRDHLVEIVKLALALAMRIDDGNQSRAPFQRRLARFVIVPETRSFYFCVEFGEFGDFRVEVKEPSSAAPAYRAPDRAPDRCFYLQNS